MPKLYYPRLMAGWVNISKLLCVLLLLHTSGVLGQDHTSTTANAMLEEFQQKLDTAANPADIAFLLTDLAFLHKMHGRHESALDALDSAMTIVRVNNFNYLLPRIHGNYGEVYNHLGDVDAALEHHLAEWDCLKFVQESKVEKKDSAFVLQLIASDLNRLGFTHDAMDTMQRVIRMMKETELAAWHGGVYHSLGLISADFGDHDQGERYSNKALEVYRAFGNKRSLINGLLSSASRYILMKEGEFAQARLEEVEQIINQNDLVQFRAPLHRQYATLARMRNKCELAIEQAEKSLALSVQNRKTAGRLRIGLILGECYSNTGDDHLAISAIKQGLEYRENTIYDSDIPDGYKLLAELLEKVGSHEEALATRKRYEEEESKIYERRKIEQARVLEAKFRNEQQRVEILQKENELTRSEADLQLASARVRNVSILAGGLALGALLLFAWFQQRKRLAEQTLLTVQESQRAAAMEAMIAGEERERSRIAKDLHDGLNGTLATVKMYLNGLVKDVPELSTSDRYEKAKEILEGTSVEVRRISHDLMPVVLMRDGLVDALRSYTSNINESGVLSMELVAVGMKERLNDSLELALYRIIQELINNVVKHANATKCIVQLSRADQFLEVTVEDDGDGLEGDVDQGLGLRSIRSRVEMLHGDSEFKSEKGVGTSVYMRFSLNRTTA